MKNNLVSVAAVLLFLSPVAIADTSSDEQDERRHHKESSHEPDMGHSNALEKMIRKTTEQQHAANAKKYAQIAALAGNRKDELETKRVVVINTFKTWLDLKSTVEASPKANQESFKAVEKAAHDYSEANKAFIGLQKDILAANGVPSAEFNNRIVTNAIPSDAIEAINISPATAAGSK